MLSLLRGKREAILQFLYQIHIKKGDIKNRLFGAAVLFITRIAALYILPKHSLRQPTTHKVWQPKGKA